MVLHARLSNLLDKIVHQMTILTKFGNLHISLKYKDILPKKLSSSFCHTLAYLPWKYEWNRIFNPCRVIFHFYGQGLLKGLHFTVLQERQEPSETSEGVTRTCITKEKSYLIIIGEKLKKRSPSNKWPPSSPKIEISTPGANLSIYGSLLTLLLEA